MAVMGWGNSSFGTIAFNSVLKPWHRYYTVITPNSTLCYYNALYTALGGSPQPMWHVW